MYNLGVLRYLKTGFAYVLVLGLFSAQTALPILHGAQVALEESLAHSGGIGALDRATFAPVRSGHSHHDTSTCPIDRFLSQGRWGLSSDPANGPGLSSPAEFLRFGRPVFLSPAPLFPGAAPRAPPRVS